MGSIYSGVIIKALKMVLATLLLGTQHYESGARNQNWSARCQFKVTGWKIASCVWGVIFQ